MDYERNEIEMSLEGRVAIVTGDSRGIGSGISLALAKEELPSNIRVNVVALGLVETEMGSRLVKATTGQQIEDIHHRMPFGRICQPADVGNLCAFLCSDEGGYISGHIIYLDGGAWQPIT